MSKTRQKTAEDISIVLTKISLSILFIASIVLIAIGPWVVSLVIEFPSPFFQGESRYWILLLLGYVLGCLALTCIVHLYQTECTVYALSGLGSWNGHPHFFLYGLDSLYAHAPRSRFLLHFNLDYSGYPQCFWQGN